MAIAFVFDATHKNISSLPSNALAALYTTGSPDIKASPADFNAHPHAIHIVQDKGSDRTADIIDMEFGAAIPSDVVNWLPMARASFMAVHRPGQRWPGIYLSLSRVTEMANALVAAKLTNVPLWIAHWGESQNTAIGELMNATGPFPIVGLQIQNQGVRDFSVFSDGWLDNISVIAVNQLQPPPGQWKNAREWNWKDVVTMGIGMDGKFHGFALDQSKNLWIKVR